MEGDFSAGAELLVVAVAGFLIVHCDGAERVSCDRASGRNGRFGTRWFVVCWFRVIIKLSSSTTRAHRAVTYTLVSKS